jgi:putative transcriptional regulator
MHTAIKEFRTEQNMTQEDLAHMVSVRRETIVFLEQGKYMPSLRLASAIARVFKKPIEEVFVLDKEDYRIGH